MSKFSCRNFNEKIVSEGTDRILYLTEFFRHRIFFQFEKRQKTNDRNDRLKSRRTPFVFQIERRTFAQIRYLNGTTRLFLPFDEWSNFYRFQKKMSSTVERTESKEEFLQTKNPFRSSYLSSSFPSRQNSWKSFSTNIDISSTFN